MVVCGPTASGKSELALQLSHQFNGEMVSADSMQIYSGLHIGTAALLPQDAEGISQNLVGFLPPDKEFSVAEYVALAGDAIAGIAGRGKLPVVCGGTGLYISSLVSGTVFTPQKPDEALRTKLEELLEQEGGEGMLRRLAEIDPAHAETLHAKDHKRILRALEQWEQTGKTRAEREKLSKPEERPYNAMCIAVTYPREELYRRIELRVDSMVEKGVLKEAEWVYQNKDVFKTAAQAIGYKEFFGYFAGESSLEECVAKLKQATRNYAKRQLTWFKRMDGVYWLDASQPDATREAERVVQDFLQNNTKPVKGFI